METTGAKVDAVEEQGTHSLLMVGGEGIVFQKIIGITREIPVSTVW